MSKQVLDVQQMQHLQELGLELKDTMIYWSKPHKGVICRCGNDWFLSLVDDKTRNFFDVIPAYTLQDVLDALPIEIKYKDKRCWLCIELADEMIGYYYEDYHLEHKWVYHEVVMKDENLIDAAYRLLIWVIENGYISKLPANKNSK